MTDPGNNIGLPGMIDHPDGVLAPDARLCAYAALIGAVAAYEPEALARAVAALEETASAPIDAAPPAAVLGRAWLGFSGVAKPQISQEPARVYTFAYPAHVGFQIATRAGSRTAQRHGNRAIAALLDSDRPLCALPGPLPGYPFVLNVEVWLGSGGGVDELSIENVDPAPGE